MTPLKSVTYDQRTGSLQDLPMWIRAAAIVGIPGVIAMYLVYVLANAIPAKVEAHADESRKSDAAQIRLLSQICANTATTPEEKAACWVGR